MPSMIEMLLSSSGSSPLSALSSQFDLTEDQARQAVEALAPALSIGLKRNASSPMGAGAFIETLSTGRHEQYADRPDHAVSNQGVTEGNKILGHLLGSKNVSRAVTAQAAQATGIGQSTLKQMLPALASMIMGSMFKGATQQAGGGVGGGILGKILGSVLGGGLSGGMAGGSTAQRRTSDSENPLGRMFEDMLSGRRNDGGRQAAPRQRRTTDEGSLEQVFKDNIGSGGTRSSQPLPDEIPESSGSDSLGDMLEQFLDGDDDNELQIDSGGQRRQAPSTGKLTDIFGDMFETGRQQNDPYQNGIEGIFKEFFDK